MVQVTDEMIEAFIASYKDEMIRTLGEWVKIPSVSKAYEAEEGAPYGLECKRMLDRALEEGKRLGFRSENHDGFCGSLIYGDQEREIGLVCHLDVVPEGKDWIYSPYEMKREGDFLIGRGCGDNKGPGILCLYLMRFFKENQLPLKSALRLMLGCAEETGMADYKHYVMELKGKIPEVSIVADAAFPVCYAQKGGFNAAFEIPMGSDLAEFKAGLVRNAVPAEACMLIKGIDAKRAAEVLTGVPDVSVEDAGTQSEPAISLMGHGKAGHAAHLIRGEENNAIVNAARAALVLEQKTGLSIGAAAFISECFVTGFGDGFDIAYQDEESGELTINAGVIERRGNILHLDIDIRFPVTMDVKKLEESLRHRAASYGVKLVEVDVAPPCYTSPEDPKVLALLDSYRAVTGDDSAPYSMGGGTYSRVIPGAITFGPGFMKTGHKPDFLPQGHGGAHGPDEALSITDWLDAFRIYIRAVAGLDGVL